MTDKHEVWFCYPVTLIENLLANPDFKDEFNYTPHQEYAADGLHCFCDFMLGNWSWQQVVSFYILSKYLCISTVQDTIIKDHPEALGAFFVTLILGSNKMMVSVATGHICYWPLYLSIGNIHNNVHCGHQNGLVLLGLLAIPKGMLSVPNPFTSLTFAFFVTS